MKKNNRKNEIYENPSLLIWKMSIACALSWEVARLAGSHHPVLAPLSVILCFHSTVDQSIRFSYHRIIGTVIGILTTVCVSHHLDLNAWTLGLVILGAQFIAKWLKLDEVVFHQVALTVLFVFVLEHKTKLYAMDRIRDTFIGVGVAILVHMLIFPPNFTRDGAKALKKLSDHTAASFLRTAEWIKAGAGSGEGARIENDLKILLEELHRTEKVITTAKNSLKSNPFGGKSLSSLIQYQQKLQQLRYGYSYLAEISGIFTEWAAEESIPEETKTLWAHQLRTLSPHFKMAEPGKHPEKETQDGIFTPLVNPIQIVFPPELEMQRFAVSSYDATVRLANKLAEINQPK